MHIKGVVALGSGIDRATAQRLSRDGATVAVSDIDEACARETVWLLEQGAGRAMAIPGDVANDGDVRKMISDVRSCFGRLDILVNNSGVVEAGNTPRIVFPELEPDRWIRVLEINVRGVVLGTQHAIAAMRESGGGAKDSVGPVNVEIVDYH
jgi:NAD(P)-dependent dehydrogenase (short-subunit alcohol dehydrogenase family)